MKTEQTLSSGLTIIQNIQSAVRFVFFETEVVGWEYATHGGTLFLVNFNNQIYGITCEHVFGKDERDKFSRQQLCVTNKRGGDKFAGISCFYYLKDLQQGAFDGELKDVLIIKLSEDCSCDFFEDKAYIFDKNTISTSDLGDHLIIEGTLKDKSYIDEKTISPQFVTLEALDSLPFVETDPVLRSATASYRKAEFENVVGISGSPVFNVNKNGLCGMVTRATYKDNALKVTYIDINDIHEALKAINNGTLKASYTKKVIAKKK